MMALTGSPSCFGTTCFLVIPNELEVKHPSQRHKPQASKEDNINKLTISDSLTVPIREMNKLKNNILTFK